MHCPFSDTATEQALVLVSICSMHAIFFVLFLLAYKGSANRAKNQIFCHFYHSFTPLMLKRFAVWKIVSNFVRKKKKSQDFN
jgi:hypothetical protein